MEWGTSRSWFTGIDIFFVKKCAKNDFHISAARDFDLWPFDLKIALPVNPDVGGLSSKFERWTIFYFELTVDTGHVS